MTRIASLALLIIATAVGTAVVLDRQQPFTDDVPAAPTTARRPDDTPRRLAIDTPTTDVFITSEDDGRTCVIAVMALGEAKTCGPAAYASRGQVVLSFQADADSPVIYAGVAPDGATAVISDGITVPVEGGAWTLTSTTRPAALTAMDATGATVADLPVGTDMRDLPPPAPPPPGS